MEKSKMLHYLPGCDVRKNHPQAIEKLTNYMKNQGALIDRCCRNKEDFLKENDVLVQNCTLCQLLIQEKYPQVTCLSTYEYILQDTHFPWPNHQGEVIAIQDCLRTKENRTFQEAIRKCLLKMNYTIIELEDAYEKTNFDGIWIYNEPAAICKEIAPKTMKRLKENYFQFLSPKLQEQKMKEWVKHYTSDVLVYCNGCERGLKMGGIQPIHIVELLAENL